MAKIHYTELFYSIQGEGRYMGVPSVFLRTFGCNFRCAGFGMPAGEKTQEVQFIDPAQYRIFQELPLVSTGCDSYSSVYPQFKKFANKIETNELAEKIVNLLPNQEWDAEHLVITGGEPLLVGWQKAYIDLLSSEKMASLEELTFETNGTQALTPELKAYLRKWGTVDRPFGHITFSVSAKLSCSGEARADAIKPEIVCEYEDYGFTYLKFVVSTEEDAEEALEALEIYRANGFSGPCYLMPVGGVESVYTLNNRRVAELALKHGLRYSDRLQVPLFKNAWST